MRCGVLLLAMLAAAAGLTFTSPTPALAASDACASVARPAARPALSPATRQSVAVFKAQHDTLRLPVDPAASTPAAVAAQLAARRAARPDPVPYARSAPCVAADRTVVPSLNQQGQITNYFCGPATVSEMATTRGVGVDQRTTGGWMGTDPNSGTNVDALTRGLNHFVGAPSGGNYVFVSIAYYPTADERSAFISRMKLDVNTKWPVAGDAWEVPGGPHLVGHPDVEIFHWIEIGGFGDGETAVYYADSATTVWSGVPAYSWLDMQAMITILGGRGYAW